MAVPCLAVSPLPPYGTVGVCGGVQVMLRHIEEQVGSIPHPWHRLPEAGPHPVSPTPGVWSGEEDDDGEFF